jgi:superkiller protein 3
MGNLLPRHRPVRRGDARVPACDCDQPENAEAHFNLAMMLGPRNQLDEAVAHLRRVIDINPRSPDAHRNLAIALALQGKLEEAIGHDRAALRLQPGSTAAQQHLDALLKATTGRGL